MPFTRQCVVMNNGIVKSAIILLQTPEEAFSILVTTTKGPEALPFFILLFSEGVLRLDPLQTGFLQVKETEHEGIFHNAVSKLFFFSSSL